MRCHRYQGVLIPGCWSRVSHPDRPCTCPKRTKKGRITIAELEEDQVAQRAKEAATSKVRVLTFPSQGSHRGR